MKPTTQTTHNVTRPIAKSITINGIQVKFYTRDSHYYCRLIDGDSSVLVAANDDYRKVSSAYERQVMALREEAA